MSIVINQHHQAIQGTNVSKDANTAFKPEHISTTMSNTVHIGILGLGVVGTGVFEVLKRNKEEITRRTGKELRVTAVSRRSTDKAQAVVGDAAAVLADPMDIVNMPDVDIVVELIGGTTLAKDLVLTAIANGKHVVTANKALLAVHGNEIFKAAQEKDVMVSYEAAVAGGIPIIKSMREGLSGNQIEWVAGIINGTTNYILSEMRDKGMSFADALKDAQELGYAEADPTFDIEGIDAAHKIALLGAMAFGIDVQFDESHVEGISSLDSVDIAYAEQLGYRIKLLGFAKRTTKGIEQRVHPTLVPAKRLIANVEGPMNAVAVKADAVGITMYYGQGAGSEPTASAVIADLVDTVRLQTSQESQRVPSLAFQPNALTDCKVLGMDDVYSSYYLRLRVADEQGVLAKVAQIIAKNGISIDALFQREADKVTQDSTQAQTDLILLTHDCYEHAINAAMNTMQQLPSVLEPIVRLRKEDLS